MNITGIKIENIKGIKSHFFNISILPNRPNILVAPNGFGKSSLAIAFASLHESRIILDEKDCHSRDTSLVPKIEISTSTGIVLSADDKTNSIKTEFDIFVINNPLEPKANSRNYMGRLISKPTIEIKPTILVHTVPAKKNFTYKLSSFKRSFGVNGKVLPNISSILNNGDVMADIASLDLAKIKTLKWKGSVDTFINGINTLKCSTEALRKHIAATVIDILEVGPYQLIKDILINHGIALPNERDYIFLCIWQLWQLYLDMGVDFKKACKFFKYQAVKNRYIKEIDDINPVKDRIKIIPKEENGQLIVRWPKAHEMSNGQRDILYFYAKLLEFERLKSSKPQILLIDEIFDYLDDVNILLFQYKISNLIETYKQSKKILFPILLTHLDPNFFNHFCFNEDRINVCYLKEHNVKSSPALLNIIRIREDSLVKNKLDAAYFHFHPSYHTYDLKAEFSTLGANVVWGNPITFRKKLFRLLRVYLFEDMDYDPIAVCWSVRLMIEELVYLKITNEAQREVYINTKTTKEKLRYASRIGIVIPDYYFLLGLIYNVSLHKSSIDTVQSAALKLNSIIVKEMISKIATDHFKLFGKQ